MAKEKTVRRGSGQVTPPSASRRERRSTQGERKPAEESLAQPTLVVMPTLRKTIEVPADYFFKVKERAVHRRMKEKELWHEIVAEYFKTHPEPY